LKFKKIKIRHFCLPPSVIIPSCSIRSRIWHHRYRVTDSISRWTKKNCNGSV